jgi:23S rRNA pseudouridine1911/1915/1917 synthase
MTGVRRLVASADDAGTRLDQFISRALPDLSRSRTQQLIKEGRVRLSRGRPKASLAVEDGLEVEVDVPAARPVAHEPEPLPLDVLHDDADVVVVNKPAGLVVHPAAGHAAGTLVNALLHHVSGLSGVGGRERPGIVHRLDRGTSGVMVIAKHDAAHRELARQFHDREVAKEYVALVWGTVRTGASFEKPIGRHPRQRQKMSTRARRARPAVTRVMHGEPLGGVSLIRVSIATGRTHQIRVHLSESGHPVVGDQLYGGARRKPPPGLGALNRLARPFLHAAKLTFSHPRDGRPVSFEAPLPSDLAEVLAAVRRVRGEA